MKLYNLENVRGKVEMDFGQFLSLDHYLYTNPHTKRLIYAYVKLVDNVKLSNLHELFFETNNEDFYRTEKHKNFMKNDSTYNHVFKEYIKGAKYWVYGAMQAQNYFFDGRHLLIGKYQKAIAEIVDLALLGKIMHYTGGLSQIQKTKKHVNFYQKWFDKKKEIENGFWEKFSNDLELTGDERINFYHDMIEIYDEPSTLTIQINVRRYTNSTLKILMSKTSKIKGSFDRRNTLVPKMLMRSQLVNKAYQWLIDVKNMDFVNKYLNDLEDLEEMPQFEVLNSITKQFLTELREKEKSLYFDTDWIAIYMSHKNVIERNVIHYSDKNQLLRIYRKFRFLDDEEKKTYEIQPYSLPKNVHQSSKLLLHYGFITFSTLNDQFDTYFFENLGKNPEDLEEYVDYVHKHTELFMRLPMSNTKDLFDHRQYVMTELTNQVDYDIENGNDLNYEDTRSWNFIKDKTIATFYETLTYLDDKQLFMEDREQHHRARLVRMNSYINYYQTKINIVDKIIIGDEEKQQVA